MTISTNIIEISSIQRRGELIVSRETKRDPLTLRLRTIITRFTTEKYIFTGDRAGVSRRKRFPGSFQWAANILSVRKYISHDDDHRPRVSLPFQNLVGIHSGLVK